MHNCKILNSRAFFKKNTELTEIGPLSHCNIFQGREITLVNKLNDKMIVNKTVFTSSQH